MIELIPIAIITLDSLIKLLPFVVPIATLLLGVYKDKIFEKLNLKAKEKEVDLSSTDVIEKNLQLYQTMLDDYAKRKEAEDKIQVKRIECLEGKIEKVGKENFELKSEKSELKFEKSELEISIDNLKRQVEKLTDLVNKLGLQLAYYEQHSEVKLPDNLK
ncbi:hypothetical protein [Zunongwangia atlantica]|uniref:Uncharacterized protein n=1 Tax=Zunongwangia atlantica 22II14-10F7 TaxID=1185767 RepID=A0A1Y1T4L8_9FLAO|nr:hypothetical protein [Zunongwangia atlantica]ORL45393.1 hypothetical protein IIF7_11243 [Zunongwangia atlantica 22II14-10F7]